MKIVYRATDSIEADPADEECMQLPALDFDRSPCTGYTRAHWEAVADGMLVRAWRWASPMGARLDLPGTASGSGVRSDGLEGFARTFLAAAFRVAGAGGADPHGWLSRYRSGLVAGTATPGAEDVESWPVIRDYDVFGQPMVESASVALSLRLTRPWLWDKLSAEQQDRVADWLRGALTSVPAPNNWYLFPFTVAGFLEAVGRGDQLTAQVRERALRLLDNWYVGQGWYTDGDGGSFDHYNGWALHLYPVLDEFLQSREASAGKDGSAGERLYKHLLGFGHFFGGNGAPVYYGRSMTYRFAASAAVGLGAVTGDTPLTPGASRRVLSGSLKHFLDRGALDGRGLLSLGWYGEHAATLQPYSGPSSPYWASKAFVALLAPPEDPLWTEREDPAPVETEDHVIPLEAPGFLLQSTQEDGVVRLHNHGNDHLRATNGEAGSESNPLYSRWAYSTHTGPSAPENQADNDVAVLWRGARGVRTRVHALGTGAEHGVGWAASWHRPIFPGRAAAYPGLRVTSVVVVFGAAELRIHVVSGAPKGASLQSSGWAAPRHAADVSSILLPQVGWTASDVVTAPAGTAYGISARIPLLHADLAPDRRQVFVSLASLSGSAVSADLVTSVEDLRVTSEQVSFRWAEHDAAVTVALAPVSIAVEEVSGR
ncbi:DUF2264 domain-containing protein [Nesterenkonia halotolerans]|uniref:DUF2264 domain-containing protein n=1 Tax=Nesterenkonia halotolerans TaxID=225325 RepID=A0ABR9J9N9_9MICC|nr:DUF2264 domain-containing protein [Nesterenkonia halotolerans]MBE1515715.1 hypothetical protein [Nesterenkonia halotolerans]